jgi:predicted GNAT family acetyltransferase
MQRNWKPAVDVDVDVATSLHRRANNGKRVSSILVGSGDEGVGMSVDVIRNEAAQRFETTVDGVLCVLDYRLDGKVMTISHTGVPDAVGGRGIAAALTQTAFETARRERWQVLPDCSYAIAWVKKHPEYRDLVIGS